MRRIFQIAKRLKVHVDSLGWRRAFVRATKAALSRRSPRANDDFDRRNGTDTAGTVRLWNVRVESPNVTAGAAYATARESHVKALLDPLPRKVSFVDLGCGKGRILCIAARMGFFRVVGVEFVQEWVDKAKANLAKMELRAEVICCDAAQYDLPPGPLVVYFYDPFDGRVMSPIARKLSEHPDEIWVVYVNPRCRELFAEWMECSSLTPDQSQLFTEGSVALFHRSPLVSVGYANS